MNQLETARDRQIDVELAELHGRSPTDQTEAILARLDAARPVPQARRPGWLMAALLFVATSIVVAIAVLDQPALTEFADPTDRPQPVYLESPDQLSTVPRNTEILQIGNMTKDALPKLRGLDALRMLSLGFASGSESLGRRSGRALARLPQLESLNLNRDPTIAKGFFEGLEAAGNLKELHLGGTVDSSAWPDLRFLDSLEALNLPLYGLTEADLARIALAAPQLTKLGLRSNSEISNEALLHIRRLERLQTLDLHGCVNLDTATLTTILEETAVERLELSRCTGLDGEVVDVLLAHADRLNGLALEGIPLNEAQLTRLLERFENLTSILVGGSPNDALKLSDAFIEMLAKLPNLTQVGIRNAQGFSASSIRAFNGLGYELLTLRGVALDDQSVIKALPEPPRMLKLPSGANHR